MLINHYNENDSLFKGLIVKTFKKNTETNSYEVSLEMPLKEQVCPHCGNITTKIKDYRVQNIQDLEILGAKTFISLRKRRYFCDHCKHSFTEPNPIIHRYQHFTSRIYTNAFKEFQNMQSFKSIAKRIGVSITTVIRWFDKISYPLPKLPECFSIDEFKGNADNEKYQCNLSDPVAHKVVDILPSRKPEELYKHFRNYSINDRNKVTKIVTDLSSLFRSSINTLFPNAIIIADKFHVIRVVTNSMENVRKRIQKQFYKNRKRLLKGNRKLLLTPGYKLKDEDKLVLERILASSPELEEAYILKELFYEVFKGKNKAASKAQLQNWLLLAAQLDIPEFRHCITTFTKWSEEITNIVENKVSNGFVEGMNNKIKVLKRISYGVRNFNRFRNRILYLCS